jgi:hypothetical protein
MSENRQRMVTAYTKSAEVAGVTGDNRSALRQAAFGGIHDQVRELATSL